MHQNAVPKKHSLFALVLTLFLIISSTGGLWLYVVNADAETGIQKTDVAKLPEANASNIVQEKYDNYPINTSDEDLETWYQGFGLTSEEKIRLSVLIPEYRAGKRPKEKAPSMPAETGFAIFALCPEDYAGMAEYYFLPGQKLTDEQILQLIAYGEEKGEPFTTDTLSVKNCMRGGAIETNRFRSAGEDARRDILYRRIVEEGLRPERLDSSEIAQPITSVADVPINPDVNSGLDVFHFNPIRRMTDDEIINELLLGDKQDYYLNPQVDKELQPFNDVANARGILESVFNMPLSAAKDLFQYTKDMQTGTKLLTAEFKTPKINGVENTYYLVMELQSGQCRTMFCNLMDDAINGNSLSSGPVSTGSSLEVVDINDQRCAQSAVSAIKKLTNLEVVKERPITKVSIGNAHEAGVYIALEMADGTAYIVTVRYTDAMVTGIDYQSGGTDKWLEQTGFTNIG